MSLARGPARSGARAWPRARRRRCRLAVAFFAALGHLAPLSVAAAPAGPPGAMSPAPVVAVEGGRVTVDARDADLADLLSQLADAAGFQLTTRGQLGRVTVSFTGLALASALRRLAQDYELMLVYRPSGTEQSDPELDEVAVFAPLPPSGTSQSVATAPEPQSHSVLAEINLLMRSPGNEDRIARLAEILGSAPESVVRARAAWALGRIGGAAAAPALNRAIGDQAPEVRVQALNALHVAEGSAAIPTIASVLMGDPDAMVRRAAARVLATLTEPAAISALGEAAQDADPMVRREATRALQRQGLPISP